MNSTSRGCRLVRIAARSPARWITGPDVGVLVAELDGGTLSSGTLDALRARVAAEHALKPVLFEWTASKCNSFADADDVLKVSRAVNLGNANSRSTPNGMADRKKFLKLAKKALGI